MYKRHTLESFDFSIRTLIAERGCWEWQHKCNDNGYGQVKFQGKNLSAHRLSWMKHFGSIPEGAWVLHRCDNPPCCNPDHLFLGDGFINMQDMVAKGRHRYGNDHWTRKHPERLARGDAHPLRRNPELAARGLRSGRYTKPGKTARGERNGIAKLVESDVRTIRARVASGERQAKIAEDYRVRPGHVWKIAERWLWRHVE